MDSYGMGVLVGFYFVLFLSMVCIVKANKKNVKIYDERQELVRGKGYKYAFFTMIFYFLSTGIIVSEEGVSFLNRFMDRRMETFLGVVLAVLVDTLYCIWNDGYLSIQEQKNMGKAYALFIVIIVINIAGGMSYLEECVVDGRLTFKATNLLCAFVFIVLLINIFIKRVINRKRELEDEEV